MSQCKSTQSSTMNFSDRQYFSRALILVWCLVICFRSSKSQETTTPIFAKGGEPALNNTIHLNFTSTSTTPRRTSLGTTTTTSTTTTDRQDERAGGYFSPITANPWASDPYINGLFINKANQEANTNLPVVIVTQVTAAGTTARPTRHSDHTHGHTHHAHSQQTNGKDNSLGSDWLCCRMEIMRWMTK